MAKIFVIALCCYAFDISFSIFINQIDNNNNCITLLRETGLRGLVVKAADS